MADPQTSKPATVTGVLQTILAAIGVPAIAWLLTSNWQSLGDYARNHPWQVVGLLALYKIAVFIRWFVTEAKLVNLNASAHVTTHLCLICLIGRQTGRVCAVFVRILFRPHAQAQNLLLFIPGGILNAPTREPLHIRDARTSRLRHQLVP